MSSVSHGDWSWVRWDGRGRKPQSLADAAIPVNSHILFSLPGSERVSFPRLARKGVWHGNRIRSEVTRCYLAGIVYQQTFWQLERLTGFSVMDWSHGSVVLPPESVHNYHKFESIVLFWQGGKNDGKLVSYFQSCLKTGNYSLRTQSSNFPVLAGDNFASHSWLTVLFVIVKLVITSGSWWCTPMHIFNCWHRPVLCAGWKPVGHQVNPPLGTGWWVRTQ